MPRVDVIVPHRARLIAVVVGLTGCSGGGIGHDPFAGPGAPGSAGLAHSGDVTIVGVGGAGGEANAAPPAGPIAPPAMPPDTDRPDAGIADALSPPDVCPGSAGATARTASCDQSLVANPAFDRDGAGWVGESFASRAFARRDCADNPASGSLLVTNGNHAADRVGATMAGAQQCVAIAPDANYELSAQYHLETEGAGVALGLLFFQGSSCSGSSLAFVTGVDAVPGTWTWLRSPLLAAGEAQSVLVRLLVKKDFAQPTATAFFDNVLLRRR